MPKHIVFLADGTWNGPAADENHDGWPDPTNVLKLFAMLRGSDDVGTLALANEQERSFHADGRCLQVAKYLHGVGDSRNPLVRLLGGAFGSGVIARIVRGYTFLSRHYEPGDRIVIVGFSRGAYTARALAGLVVSQGLLDRTRVDLGDRGRAYELGCTVWERHRESMTPGGDARERLFDILRGLPSFILAPRREPPLTGPVDVAAVAVFDTVGSLGIPRYAPDNARVDTFRFADEVLSGRVQAGFHALAIDELRPDFTPTLWRPRAGVEQVLFAGAHADVGGGYPAAESGLANIPLAWMRECLTGAGVHLKAPVPGQHEGEATAGSHQPWRDGLWAVQPRAPRRFSPLQCVDVHPSVGVRRRHDGIFRLYPDDAAPAPYDPPGIRDLLAAVDALPRHTPAAVG